VIRLLPRLRDTTRPEVEKCENCKSGPPSPEATEGDLDFSREIQAEHIVQDGGSENWDSFSNNLHVSPDSERSRESTINNEQSSYNLQLHSEADNGMYDAINKGFENATGDVVAWIKGGVNRKSFASVKPGTGDTESIPGTQTRRVRSVGLDLTNERDYL